MSPRGDGMPEGHPEKLPTKIATLTLFGIVDDDGRGMEMTTPELRIHVGCRADEAEVLKQVVLNAMKGIIDNEAGPCPCGQCGAESGDA